MENIEKCKYYDEELDCCKYFSDWSDAMLEELQEELDFESLLYTKEQNEWFKKGLECAVRDVKYQPTVDVAEVRHGHWEVCSDEYEICASEFVCSVCKESFCSSELTDEQFFEMMQYCPHCGARMDGDAE